MPTVTNEQVIEKLKEVFDPEIPVDVYNFGLIYDISVAADDRVDITMTLTSESCPSAKQIPFDVQKQVEQIDGVTSCEVEVVWEPRWSPERISPEGKKLLGMDDDG